MAAQQRDLIVIATVLMLLIIIPVMVLTVMFARRYREQNEAVDYDPDWDHSTALEFVVWAAPLLIIICLGAVTWTGTHRLDPYRPVERITAHKALAKDVKPLDIEVVSLDWKWLFIYPEYGIATVNEVAAPVDRPIAFHLTSSSVMNAFYIPTLAGMIYTMPGMETKLHAVINKPGDYEGFSSNFSGDGFSKMRFRFNGMSEADFSDWVKTVHSADKTLDRPRYLTLEQPSSAVPVMHFGTVTPDLFEAILNQCVKPGTRCMSDMMKADKQTAAGEGRAPTLQDMGEMKGHIAEDVRLHGAGLTPPDRKLRAERTAMNDPSVQSSSPSTVL